MPLIREWYEVDIDGPPMFNGKQIRVTETDLVDLGACIRVPLERPSPLSDRPSR